jgi:hypothetical protein
MGVAIQAVFVWVISIMLVGLHEAGQSWSAGFLDS